MQERRHSLAGSIHQSQVDVHDIASGTRAAVEQHLTPRIDHHGVAVSLSPSWMDSTLHGHDRSGEPSKGGCGQRGPYATAYLRCCDDEAAVLNSPGTQQSFPVRFAGGTRER